MPRSITFQREQPYTRKIYSGEVVWVPETNAEFRTQDGESRTGRAILDTGSPWCAMPKSVAADYLGIDVPSCPLQTLTTVDGARLDLPYTHMIVRAFGAEFECKVLLTNGGPYLLGRLPFFSLFEFAFHEENDGRAGRILVGQK